jgi:ribonuclease R
VDERFKCAWMEKHVGSEFAGTITGVTSFGLFVELAASRVSGLVHVSQLPNDYYKFDPIRHLLSGERTGSTYRLGDYVSVQVLRASMEDRKIDFRLVARLAQLPKPAPKVEVTAPAAPSSGMAKAGKAIGRAAKKAMSSIFGKKTKAPVAVEAPAARQPAPARAPAPAPTSRRRAAEPAANEQQSSRSPRRRSQEPASGQSGRNERPPRNEQSPRKATTKKTAAKKTAVTKQPTRQAPVATSETPAPAKKSARRRSRKPRSKPEA